jgi:hypothetical protein
MDEINHLFWRLKDKAALIMSNECNHEFQYCIEYLDLILMDQEPQGLFNFYIDPQTLKSLSNRKENIYFNLGEWKALNLVEAAANIVNVLITEGTKPLVVNSVLALVYFVRTCKELKNIELGWNHTLLILAIHYNKSLDIEDPFMKLNDVVQHYKDAIPQVLEFDQELFLLTMRQLIELELVLFKDNKLFLTDQVVLKSSN